MLFSVPAGGAYAHHHEPMPLPDERPAWMRKMRATVFSTQRTAGLFRADHGEAIVG